MSSSVNKSSSHTFLPATSTGRHTPRQQQLYINRVYIMWSLLQGVSPALSVRLNQKPAPLATGNCSLRSPSTPRRPSSLPGPRQASSTFTEGLIPSAQAHGVPPAALLSCQHFLHSSVDIPASRACVQGMRPSGQAWPGHPPAPNSHPIPGSPCWPHHQNFL